MSSVNHISQVRQFRCRVEGGVMRYEQRVTGAGGANNYQSAEPVVVQTAWNDFYRKPETLECAQLTAGFMTAEVFPSALSAGSLNPAALSTFAKITNMASASALCTSSDAISGK